MRFHIAHDLRGDARAFGLGVAGLGDHLGRLFGLVLNLLDLPHVVDGVLPALIGVVELIEREAELDASLERDVIVDRFAIGRVDLVRLYCGGILDVGGGVLRDDVPFFVDLRGDAERDAAVNGVDAHDVCL